jgi:hypothetical protein
MNFRFAATAVLAALCVTASAIAQQPTAYDKNQDTRIDELVKQVATLRGDLTSAQNELQRKLEAQSRDINALLESVKEQSGQITALTNLSSTNVGDIRKLKADYVASTDHMNGEVEKMRKQLNDISTKDGERYVPKVSANMDVASFHKDMEKAVNDSIGKEGNLYIVNKTGYHQWVYINRTAHYLPPGNSDPIPVRVGTATTQLPGQDLQTWTITAPLYEQRLEIVPSPMPIRSWLSPPNYVGPPRYIGPPIYVDPPLFLGSTTTAESSYVAYR